MRLEILIKSLGIRLPERSPDFDVRGITQDSRKVRDNFVFIAVRGVNFDGHEFIKEAIQKGARAIIIQDNRYQIANNRDIVWINVPDTRHALAQLISEFYGHPSLKMKVVGITGTNGKTTISYLIEAILKSAGFNPAVIGTINYRFKDKIFEASNTTPGSEDLQALLAQMHKEKVDYVIIEVSSHALDQERVNTVKFSCAIFSNLSVDHLDYHGNLESYFTTKSRLFRVLTRDNFAILNVDDPRADELIKLTKAQVITYGLNNNADISAEEISYTLKGTEFFLRLNSSKIKIFSANLDRVKIKTPLIGNYNVYNILAAIGFALIYKIDSKIIQKAMEGFKGVPGRLERIPTKSDFYIFVDYAHTEDALRNVITALRALCKGHIYVVFGCGGNRDRSKRPKMGRAVSELADFAIVTTDNPRNEKPEDIISDIISGIERQNFKVILERKEAIKEALSLAKNNDIILIAGKGHEDRQIFKDRVIRFDDREVVWECLGLNR